MHRPLSGAARPQFPQGDLSLGDQSLRGPDHTGVPSISKFWPLTVSAATPGARILRPLVGKSCTSL